MSENQHEERGFDEDAPPAPCLQGLERLRPEVKRLRGCRVLSAPGQPLDDLRLGAEVSFEYEGQLRHARVVAVTPWGFRGWDLDRHGWRSFRSEKVAVVRDSEWKNNEVGHGGHDELEQEDA